MSYEQHDGYTIHRNLHEKEESERAYRKILEELCDFVLLDKAPELIKTFGLEVTKFFNCRNFQQDHNLPDSYVRSPSNSRESKIVRKTGRTDIYLSETAREMAGENEAIYNILHNLYAKVTQIDTPLAFTNGLDQLCVKSYGCEENLPTLDCKMFESFGPPTCDKNPFHYFALYCFGACTNINIANRGQISILRNFDRHFTLLSKWMSPGGQFDQGRQRKGSIVTVFNNFNLNNVNNALKSHYLSRNESHLYLPLEWITVNLQIGELLVIDCRIPYKFHKNDNNIPAIYTTISLLPIPQDWKTSSRRTKLIKTITSGFVGDSSKRVLKGTNTNEYTWRKNNTAQYSLDKIVDTHNFSTHNKIIYGLDTSP
tara:strand:+ start:22576 stop:23685 length:1110 start_codon:yes stop_codon:yes gene_type:complete